MRSRKPLPVIDAALRADAGKLPALVGVDLGTQGYAVVRVTKIVPRTRPRPNSRSRSSRKYGRSIAAAEDAAYYDLLKARFKAEILVPKPAERCPPRRADTQAREISNQRSPGRWPGLFHWCRPTRRTRDKQHLRFLPESRPWEPSISCATGRPVSALRTMTT
jgi:hypothetical protein